MQPGLYKDEKMVMSWKDLIKQEIVHLENSVLTTNYIPDTEEMARFYTEEERDDNKSSDYLDGILVLPNDGSVKELGDNCFCVTKKLSGVILPDGLEIIRKSAFATSAIEKLFVPDSVLKIEQNAFYNCQRLTFLRVPNTITYFNLYGIRGAQKNNIKFVYGIDHYKNIYEFEETIKCLNVIKEKTIDELLDDYTFKKINDMQHKIETGTTFNFSFEEEEDLS